MKTSTTRNHAAESLNLPAGWHVNTFPGGTFVFERYDDHGRIVETRTTRNPHETALEILNPSKP